MKRIADLYIKTRRAQHAACPSTGLSPPYYMADRSQQDQQDMGDSYQSRVCLQDTPVAAGARPVVSLLPVKHVLVARHGTQSHISSKRARQLLRWNLQLDTGSSCHPAGPECEHLRGGWAFAAVCSVRSCHSIPKLALPSLLAASK